MRIGGAVFGLLVLAALGVEAAGLAAAAGHLQHGTAELADASKALGSDPTLWTTTRIASADSLRTEARGQLVSGSERLHSDLLISLARHVPVVSAQVSTAVDLADGAVVGADTLGDMITVSRAVSQTRLSQAPAGERVLNLITSTGPSWALADSRISPVIDRLEADLKGPVVPPLAGQARSLIATFQPVRDQARLGALAATYAPDALGATQPRSYLVLLPNSSELRPAGGFSGSIATVVMDKGSPTNLEVKNQETFNPKITKHVDPPYPLGRYLKFFKNSLEIGDAGWDPDFPSTAKTSEALFTSAGGRAVDGTLSVDPYAISAMLEVTGPVDVPDYGRFTSADFLPRLNFIVNASTAPGSGKQALSPIGQAVVRHILTAPAAQFPGLIKAFQEQSEARHIQVSLHNPSLDQAASTVHYDGALLHVDQDYLMVVDGNVGANKADFYVRKSMDLRAEVPSGGISRHQLVLNYSMPTPLDSIDRALNPGDGAYRDYVRIYIPQTANVAAVTGTMDGQPVPDIGLDSISFDHDRQVVGAFLRVPRGHVVSLTLTYQVPLKPQSRYGLVLQKQAGVLSLPTAVEVSYPGGQEHWTSDLARDLRVDLRW